MRQLQTSSDVKRKIGCFKPCVLIISDDHENLVELRVRIPFDSLYKTGHIRGYHIFHRGKIVRSVGIPCEIATIDAVWVQRVITQSLLFLIETFGDKFIYDIDDNFLVNPEYGRPFDSVVTEIVRLLLSRSKVVSTTSGRLMRSLQSRSKVRLEGKYFISPNIIEDIVVCKKIERPDALVLAVSGHLPLTRSRDSFCDAIERFVIGRSLDVFMIGSDIKEFGRLGGKVRRAGMLDYFTYTNVIRQNNFIGIAPLEGLADPITQEFVDSKSDVKMVEFGSSGVPSVFAKVAPYLDTPLEGGVLADMGDADGILDALERVYLDGSRIGLHAADSVQDNRLALSCAPLTWFKAVEAGIMSNSINLADFVERESVYSQRNLGPEAQIKEILGNPGSTTPESLGSASTEVVAWSSGISRTDLILVSSEISGDIEILFDAAFYLYSNPDVKQAGCDAYGHYIEFGIEEGRNPNAYFDIDWYVARNPEAGMPKVDPLRHYLFIGAPDGKDPGPNFSTLHYRMLNPAMGLCNPLVHYLRLNRELQPLNFVPPSKYR